MINNLSFTPTSKALHFKISGSKSESNRALILDHVLGGFNISNLSNSDDTAHLLEALKQLQSTQKSLSIDVGHAGTTMRFLTALCATMTQREFRLQGSDRMHQRPIRALIEALKQVGADITYLGEEGFPPLKIRGQQLKASAVTIQASISSQFITALMLIAPKFEKGLEINLEGKVTSRPYIEMTKSLLEHQQIKVNFSENKIQIEPYQNTELNPVKIESDWSSASYHYALVALSAEGSKVKLSTFKSHSFQGDAALRELFELFGVETKQINSQTIEITKVKQLKQDIRLDLQKTPDLAQTIAVSCLGLGINCQLTGLHTLKIKETDRLLALQIELQKLGGKVDITSNSLKLVSPPSPEKNQIITTYNDHRMALAFAPLALIVSISIKNPEVVSKSYPNYWEDISEYGIISSFTN